MGKETIVPGFAVYSLQSRTFESVGDYRLAMKAWVERGWGKRPNQTEICQPGLKSRNLRIKERKKGEASRRETSCKTEEG